MKYRPEIDGLRAIAVVPVILYHAAPELVPGGYIGVDIFFVISGYLITSLLMEDLRLGRFSILGFYERRARRILPALFVMLLATLPLAWQLLTNDEILEYLRSLKGAAAFYSNVFFWQEQSYFGVAAESKPLLHTWSLAVEEQYYVITPLLMWLAWRINPRFLAPTLILLTAASFVLSGQYSPRYPDASFYLLHTRYWELGVGAVCALYERRNLLSGPRGLGLVGLGMIAYALFVFDDQTIFPGFSAAVPVVGTAFVIHAARPGSVAAQLLDLGLMRWIGLVSYSAYLWHQPILVFSRRLIWDEMSGPLAVSLGLTSFVLAYLSWRYVEKPFRDRSFMTRRRVLATSMASIICVVLGAQALRNSDARNHRVLASGHTTAFLAELQERNRGLGDCEPPERYQSDACRTASDPQAVLWGDSYAMHLAGALKASPTELTFVQITKSACGPYPGFATWSNRYGTSWGVECVAHNEAALGYILALDASVVILSSPFGLFRDTAITTTADGEIVRDNGSTVRAAFAEMIGKLKAAGKQPVIVSPVPRPKVPVSDCIIKASIAGEPWHRCDFLSAENTRIKGYRHLAAVASQAGIPIVLLSDVMCADGTCPASLDGTPLYRDASHLSITGSMAMGRRFDLAAAILAAAR